MEVKLLNHASLKIKDEDKIIYIDPFKIDINDHDATHILITHDHYDHLSIEDIKKIINPNTILVGNLSVCKILKQNFNNKIFEVKPNFKYTIQELNFETVEAYNIGKQFHKNCDNNVGYILNLGDLIYIAGDTDDISQDFNVDIAIVPVGGTYTMNSIEAAKCVNRLKPKYASCYHYGSIVGTIEDKENFKKLLDDSITFLEI